MVCGKESHFMRGVFCFDGAGHDGPCLFRPAASSPVPGVSGVSQVEEKERQKMRVCNGSPGQEEPQEPAPRRCNQPTPGPGQADDYVSYVFANNGQMMVCEIRGWGYLTGYQKLSTAEAAAVQAANAHLIAAAPDLLAVCRDLEWIGMNDGRGVTQLKCPACSALKSRGTGHNHYCGLDAAIRKAEGR